MNTSDTAGFDDIRPYHDHEVRTALAALVRDPALTDFMGSWLAPRLHGAAPWLVRSLVSLYLRLNFLGVSDIAGFQRVVARYARRLLRDSTTQFVYEGFERLEPGHPHLFIGNHRDIAGDSMLLDYALHLMGSDTVRIAIGDNLVQREFATAIMRLNKGFFIKRSVTGPRQTYAALLQSSRYIRASIGEGESVWLAQSEGRSKDGFDVTDPAIVKMLLLANRRQPIKEALDELRIVPLAISYELDPCDELKAKEQCITDQTGSYVKPPGEDLLSLVRGLSGQKGRVTLRLGEVLQGDFESPEAVAMELDRQIVSRLELYPLNHWAVLQLNESPYRELHDLARQALDGREVAEAARMSDCPPEHLPYLLRMYANPVVNRERVLNHKL